MFTEANKFLKSIGKDPFCKVQLVGLSNEVRVAGGIYTVFADVLAKEVAKTDLIIIPALDGDMGKII